MFHCRYKGAVEVENNPTKAKEFLNQCDQILKSNTEEMARDFIDKVVQRITKNKSIDVEINEIPENISIHSEKSEKSVISEKSEKSDKCGLLPIMEESSAELIKSKHQ